MEDNAFIGFAAKVKKEIRLTDFIKSLQPIKNSVEAKEINHEIIRSAEGGKYIRPTLLIVGYLAGNKKNIKAVYPAARALELIHLSLLIHDDIIDKAPIRRFKPTTIALLSKKFNNAHLGMSGALLVGDFIRSIADESFLQSNISKETLHKAFALYSELKKEVDFGQYLDLKILQKKNISEKDLERVWVYKTAKYSFEKPLIIGAALAGAPKKTQDELCKIAVHIGMVFQIQDDILGVFGNEKDIGKSAESDIREGKQTILTMQAYKNSSASDKKIMTQILGNDRASKVEVALVRDIFIKSGAREIALEKSATILSKAKKMTETAPLPSNAKNLLLSLIEYLAVRKIIDEK